MYSLTFYYEKLFSLTKWVLDKKHKIILNQCHNKFVFLTCKFGLLLFSIINSLN